MRLQRQYPLRMTCLHAAHDESQVRMRHFVYVVDWLDIDWYSVRQSKYFDCLIRAQIRLWIDYELELRDMLQVLRQVACLRRASDP